LRQRVLLPLMVLLPAAALGQSAAPADAGDARFGLRPRAAEYGLHLPPAKEQAAPQAPARFAPAPGASREGWTAFGTMGPMRWAQPLSEDASMSWRLGGRAPGMPNTTEAAGLPKRLNMGLQYRF